LHTAYGSCMQFLRAFIVFLPDDDSPSTTGLNIVQTRSDHVTNDAILWRHRHDTGSISSCNWFVRSDGRFRVAPLAQSVTACHTAVVSYIRRSTDDAVRPSQCAASYRSMTADLIGIWPTYSPLSLLCT